MAKATETTVEETKTIDVSIAHFDNKLEFSSKIESQSSEEMGMEGDTEYVQEVNTTQENKSTNHFNKRKKVW